MTLLLEMPGWLVLQYMRQYGPVLSAFNQGRKQNLWDCTCIAGKEFTLSNSLEMQLANLGHLYLQLHFMRHSVFYRCSKLLVQAARQLCKSGWITWFLPP